MAFLELRDLSKKFGTIAAVRHVTLSIERGEFLALVGPSGCGKSSLLRLIAGLERPDEGILQLDGRDITSTIPQKRGIGLVFQNYALFPHMTVARNVGFGLEGRGLSKEEIAGRVGVMLDAVSLSGKEGLPVTALSGGEQQRVAVARALVVEPSVLLFDEPLSNLDVALRQQTREEIRALQRKTGITTVYVTHDQSEALSMADRVAVMRAGEIEQVGTPVDVYERPASAFVAAFLGGANLLPPGGEFRVPHALGARPGDLIAVKPESIRLSAAQGGRTGGALDGHVIEREYSGFVTMLVVRVGSATLRVTALSSDVGDLRPGDRVRVVIDWSHGVLCRESAGS
jgi:ABC-type Fe3+/spermidine/putrescine transport system ATPase subunit